MSIQLYIQSPDEIPYNIIRKDSEEIFFLQKRIQWNPYLAISYNNCGRLRHLGIDKDKDHTLILTFFCNYRGTLLQGTQQKLCSKGPNRKEIMEIFSVQIRYFYIGN